MTLMRSWEAAGVRSTCERLTQGSFSGDLSGFPFQDCGPIRGYRITNSTLKGANFVNLSIRSSRFENDDFTKVDFRDISDHGNEFIRCQFDRTNFRGVTIGFDGSRYVNCTFQKVPFGGAGFVRPVFEDCAFLHCVLRNVDFEAGSFVRCKFVGELRDVWFRNGYSHPLLAERFGAPPVNPMRDVDFSEATLWGVSFGGGVDLSTVIPPKDGQHRSYDRWRVRFANLQIRVSGLPLEVQPEVRKFIYAYEPSSASQDFYILNQADLRQMVGEPATEAIVDLLGRPLR